MHAFARTARTTGVFYLGIAVAGILGFLVIRSQLFDSGNPAATLANVNGHKVIARAGIALELLVVFFQALTAIWFYRLFRSVESVAAASIAAFGLVNATVVLMSAACLASAYQVAAHPFGDAASIVQVLYLLTGDLWTAGGLFFGLWLIPMGWCVLRSRWMPRPLGWLLIAGGAGYILGTFATYLVPGAPASAFTTLATIGEFWMLGYLLIRGVRSDAQAVVPQEDPK